jgi:hypothetical protein
LLKKAFTYEKKALRAEWEFLQKQKQKWIWLLNEAQKQKKNVISALNYQKKNEISSLEQRKNEISSLNPEPVAAGSRFGFLCEGSLCEQPVAEMHCKKGILEYERLEAKDAEEDDPGVYRSEGKVLKIAK